MKQYSATDAKQRFGELMEDVMRGESVRIVRNGRVAAYIVSPQIMESLERCVSGDGPEGHSTRSAEADYAPSRALTERDETLLQKYSRGEIGIGEVKATLQCETWELIDLLGERNLPVPRMSREKAQRMADDFLNGADVEN